MALPRITARIVSLFLRASDIRFSTTTPIPSPLPYPLARASNVKHLPSGLRKLSAVMGIMVFGVKIIPEPAAMAWLPSAQ